MDQLLMTLLSWQFLLFCLALAAIIEVARRFIEYFVKDVKDLTLWDRLILPVAPVFLGVLFGLAIKMYPYPSGIVAASARAMFGLTAGLLSGFIYRALKAFIKSFIKDKDQGVTTYGAPSYGIDNSLVEAVRETINQNPIVPTVPGAQQVDPSASPVSPANSDDPPQEL